MFLCGFGGKGLVGVVALVTQIAVTGGAPDSTAQDYHAMNCEDLWHARNSIFAAKGYCFKTERARAVFGTGCHPPYGKLAPEEQQQVDLISAAERAKGCR